MKKSMFRMPPAPPLAAVSCPSESEVFPPRIPIEESPPAGRAPMAAPRPSTRLDLAGAAFRQRHDYASSMRHRGNFDRDTLPSLSLTALLAQLRTGWESSRDPRALHLLIALVLGLAPNRVRDVPVHPVSCLEAASIWIDVQSGAVVLDYQQLLTDNAVAVRRVGGGIRTQWLLLKPLPAFIVDGLKTRLQRSKTPVLLGELLGNGSFLESAPINGDSHGRLRTTASRALRGMPAFALRMGIDRYLASLICGAPEICGRSRLYYVRLQPDQFHRELDRFYEAVGLGSAHPASDFFTFGSTAVPSEKQVTASVRSLSDAAESRPERRTGLDGVIRHHNACVRAWAFNFAFLGGLRESTALDLCASRLRPGTSALEYHDKSSDRFKRLHPFFLGPLLVEQTRLVWTHLQAVHRRASGLAVTARTPWFRALESSLAGSVSPLLFLIEGDRARPVATSDFQSALPETQRMARNAGRHYWQTYFHEIGASTESVDVWARHSSLGHELLASHNCTVIDDTVCGLLALQDRRARELGFYAVAGLVKRITRL